MNEAYEIIGDIALNGLLIIADHASNHVPAHINLGLSENELSAHIAWDIGVDGTARQISAQTGCAGIMAVNSRLLVDLNRYADEDAVIPHDSDGTKIAGNQISFEEREERLQRYYHPYHDHISDCLKQFRPALILSLHSFTPQLSSKPDEARPWEIGVLYNQDDRAARIAIPALQNRGILVGDQLPYSGKQLNATMNRHAEANGIAYLGIELRQDLVADKAGQTRFADILAEICHNIIETLGVVMQNQ